MKHYVITSLLLSLYLIICTGCESCRRNTYNPYSNDAYSRTQVSTYCDFNTAAVIGALYVYSSPVQDQSEIREFVIQNSLFLTADSHVINCMRRLGNQLVSQGYSQFQYSYEDQDRVRSSVYDMAAGSGLDAMSIADDITGSMNSEALEPIIVGQELLWLAEVIPDAANNNWQPYQTTGTYFRQLAIQEMAQYNALLELYGSFDPDMAAMLDGIMPEVNQWINQYGMWYIITTGVYLGIFE